MPTKAKVALAVLAAACMWFYVQRILIPYQISEAASYERPRGNLSDLYPRWLGARELLLHHRDPYGADVTREIQAGYYGRVLDPSRPYDPKDEQRFAYPVYVVFLLAPIVKLPYSIVKPAFFWLLLVLTGFSVFWWLRALPWKPRRSDLWVIVLLTLGSFPAVQGLKLQQLTLLIAALLALCTLLMTRGQFAVAGFILALVTIKPQLTSLLAAWLILWTVSNLPRRWHFLAGFAVTLTVLFAGGELVLPGWFGRFLQGLEAYWHYTGGAESCLDVLFTPAIGHWLTAALILTLGILCWHARANPANSRKFFQITATVLAVTVVVVPMVADYNQLLLLPAVFLILTEWQFVYRGRSARMITAVTLFALLWPWFAATALSIASLFGHPEVVQQGWALPIYTRVAVPVAVVTLLIPVIIKRGHPPPVSDLPRSV